jgi:hypothetical protein
VTVTRLLSDIGNAALWASGAAIMIWIVQYSLLAPWWRSMIGISLVGLALVDLCIFLPSLMALADPADYAKFAQTRWYLYLTVTIVIASAVFVCTRIVVWEKLRRERKRTGRPALPTQMHARIVELEQELAACREQLNGP